LHAIALPHLPPNLTSHAGIFEYSGPDKYKAPVTDGAVPEYSRSMGPRTRFGDGDGSFWDKWVGAGNEAPGKGLGYDQNRIPLQRGFVQPKAGFKRYYKSQGGDFPSADPNSTVKPYSQRRLERLERERREREGYVEPALPASVGACLRDADWKPVESNRVLLKQLSLAPPAEPEAPKKKKLISSDEDSNSDSDSDSSASEDKAAPAPVAEVKPEPAEAIPDLSFAEREIYFGDRARAAFFDAYRHISRQQNILSGLAPGVKGVDVLSKLGNTTFEEIIQHNEGVAKRERSNRRTEVVSMDVVNEAMAADRRSSRKNGVAVVDPNGKRRTSSTVPHGRGGRGSVITIDSPASPGKASLLRAAVGGRAPSPNARPQHRKHMGYHTEEDDEFFTRDVEGMSRTERLHQLMDNKTVADKQHVSQRGTLQGRLGMDMFRRCDSIMVEKKAQETHLTRPEGGVDAFLRPGSPRTRYLTGCLKHSVAPRPNLIIRKDVTSVLNIEYQYIGDTMASILANSLEGLPHLTELNVAGNKLTDVGLTALILALPSCPTVNTVNFSENKIDASAARALSDYISSPGCNIMKLIMRRSDIDDNEIDSFVLAVERCKTMRHLDLGENRIGSNQSAGGGAVNANKQSGGTVLASLLENSSSKIDTLKVPWNVIRFDDACRFTRSIRDNICLTHLDISFNAIGEDGGMALGDALHTNKVLLHLNIANNSISPAAAFAIATGILSCRSLKEVNMTNNPIGEDGGRAIMMVAGLIAMETKIDIGGCTLHANESSSWFNVLKPRVGRDRKKKEAVEIDLQLPVPYDRAVCLQLLRIAATDEEFSCPKLKYIPVARVDGRGVQDIKLYLNDEAIPDTEKDSFSWLSAEGVQIVTQVNTAPGALDMIKMGFNMIDAKKTGHLGPWQMLRLVQQMGFKNASDIEMLLKQLFILHAVSSASLSGAVKSSAHSHSQDEVSCDEVMEFFVGIYRYCTSIKPIDTVIRFYHENENAWKKEPYIPHDMGSMKILLSYADKKPKYTRTLSARNVQNILETASRATDISKAIEYGLSHCKLQFQEAQTILKELLKDTGNKVKALTTLLPKLATSNDVKWFQGLALSFNSKEQHLIKTELGGLYRYLIGCLNGYYNLQLNKESDTLCLVNLIRRSIGAQALPENSDLVLANKNALIGFRNVLLDGQSTVITPEWLENMPNIGRVEFDFVDLHNEKSDFFRNPLTDWRFMQTIDGLELCCAKFSSAVTERLATIRASIELEAAATLLYAAPSEGGAGGGGSSADDETTAVSGTSRRESKQDLTLDVTKAYWRMDERSAEKEADYVDWCIANCAQRETAKSTYKFEDKHSTGVYAVPGAKKAKREDPINAGKICICCYY
jgi:Ran GTPase-activating protein (RanGAP) involved in mRNA processing and transport